MRKPEYYIKIKIPRHELFSNETLPIRTDHEIRLGYEINVISKFEARGEIEINTENTTLTNEELLQLKMYIFRKLSEKKN